MAAVRLLLADDHEIVRRGLRALLEAHPDWSVCGEATDGHAAVAQTRDLRPDVVVMDISMPGLNGLDASRQILQAEPQTQILILSMHDSCELVQAALDAGARAYVLKSDPPLNLIAAIEALSEHTAFLSPRVSTVLVESYHQQAPAEAGLPARSPLSAREVEVLRLLAEGRSAKEAADMLRLSDKTIAAHRSNIMRKLNLGSVSDLVRYAIRHHLMTP